MSAISDEEAMLLQLQRDVAVNTLHAIRSSVSGEINRGKAVQICASLRGRIADTLEVDSLIRTKINALERERKEREAQTDEPRPAQDGR